MSLARLLNKDDPRLKTICAEVQPDDDSIQSDLDALHSALNEFRSQHGFGRAIAAPQLGIMKRIVAINLDGRSFELINPTIHWHSEQKQTVWDDCLSLPDILVQVNRHNSISLSYTDKKWQTHQWEKLTPSDAELIQHEVDHLDGILMTDRAIDSQSIRPMSERQSLVNRD